MHDYVVLRELRFAKNELKNRKSLLEELDIETPYNVIKIHLDGFTELSNKIEEVELLYNRIKKNETKAEYYRNLKCNDGNLSNPLFNVINRYEHSTQSKMADNNLKIITNELKSLTIKLGER